MAYRILSRLVGLLLLAAAGLKLYGMDAAPLARVGLFSAPWIQTTVIMLEVILGSLLLVGAAPVGAWLLTIALFTGFAIVSFDAARVGETSCG